MLKVTHNGWAGGEVRNPRSVASTVVRYWWSVAGCETYCRDPIGRYYVIA